MKIFLSWSGERSRAMAEALRDWLPLVIQSLQPWLSSADVQKGARWGSEISRALEEARIGIICLTPENLEAPWLLWEAGALSHSRALVIPYLLGVRPSELGGPLVQFQVATATREDTKQLVQTINRAIGDSGLASDILEIVFERWWPVLAERLALLSADRVPAQGDGERGASATDPITEQLASLSDRDRTLLTNLVKAISGAPEPESTVSREVLAPDTVFVVHGHNHGMMEKTARFIEKLGAEAIVLHEQPNEGRTVIEKFELHSNTKYAVVLLTADDQGGSNATPFDQQTRRARQNVILELGYFLARLGRNRVCVLYENGVELPSDIAGLVYVELDKQDAWKWHLARELKTAGLRVDLNKAV